MATTTTTTTTNNLIDLFALDEDLQGKYDGSSALKVLQPLQPTKVKAKAQNDDDDGEEADDESEVDETSESPTTFEGAVEKLGEVLTGLYSDRDESEQLLVQQIVDEAKKASIVTFGKLYQQLVDQVMDQEEQIGMLEAQIQAKAAETAAVNQPKLSDVKVPTLEWIIKNHKGKGDKLGGYHIFCMVYRKIFGHFPEEGVWKVGMNAQAQKPWKDVAAQYTAHRAAQKLGAPVVNPFAATPAPTAVPASAVAFNPFAAGMTPQMLQAMLLLAQQSQASATGAAPVTTPAPVLAGEKESKANSAYRLWLNDELKKPENKGKLNLPKGSWANVPADVKAKYEAKLKALQAARSLKA